ncbi:hypothetical protein Y1Q_0007061 [Alligator mississippiensis]|uniref:Uncharacterized protein n=1 Tax=Alligator mississippiensis TaxID=8496 RepID=A0A151N5Q9_ALLMI|nr:hypothetical protein Y1Q_0007061 [Alligator mississippiensis]
MSSRDGAGVPVNSQQDDICLKDVENTAKAAVFSSSFINNYGSQELAGWLVSIWCQEERDMSFGYHLDHL